MGNYIFLAGAVLLGLLSLFLWIRVSKDESPLFNLMPYCWSRLTDLSLASLICSALSFFCCYFSIQEIYPAIDKDVLLQVLVIGYILTYGMAYIKAERLWYLISSIKI